MVFHVFSSISHQQNIIPQDLINNNNILTRATNNSVDSTILATNNMGKGRPMRQLLPPNLDHKNDDNDDDDNKKKMIHREIEKQRRKEMATLHTGLRSLIPLEYIKVYTIKKENPSTSVLIIFPQTNKTFFLRFNYFPFIYVPLDISLFLFVLGFLGSHN